MLALCPISVRRTAKKKTAEVIGWGGEAETMSRRQSPDSSVHAGQNSRYPFQNGRNQSPATLIRNFSAVLLNR